MTTGATRLAATALSLALITGCGAGEVGSRAPKASTHLGADGAKPAAKKTGLAEPQGKEAAKRRASETGPARSLESLASEHGPAQKKPVRGLVTPTVTGFAFDLAKLPVSDTPTLPLSRNRPSQLDESKVPSTLVATRSPRKAHEIYPNSPEPFEIKVTDLDEGFLTVGYHSGQIGKETPLRVFCDSATSQSSYGYGKHGYRGYDAARLVHLRVEGLRRTAAGTEYVTRQGWFDMRKCRGAVDEEQSAVLGEILPGLAYGYRTCAPREASGSSDPKAASSSATPKREPCTDPDQLVVLLPRANDAVSSETRTDGSVRWGSRLLLSTRKGTSSSVSAQVTAHEAKRFSKAVGAPLPDSIGDLLVQVELLAPSDSPAVATLFVGTPSGQIAQELRRGRKRSSALEARF